MAAYICAHCQRTFEGRRRHTVAYCSGACAHAAQEKKVAVPCFGCGQEVLRPVWRVARTPYHFCTPACRARNSAAVREARADLASAGSLLEPPTGRGGPTPPR